MQTVDEKPETIHLYVVREEVPKPQLFPIFLSVFALLVLAAICTLFPYEQPVTRAVIRVPAVPLPLQTFAAYSQLIPTGIKTYPATTAHGILTITNGSIISQTIPQGFTIDGVATDTSVFVPAGSASGYGYVTVTAHTLQLGKKGNILPGTINVVEGSSIYIRNLNAFSGGRDAYSVKFITSQDRQIALEDIRQTLIQQVIGLHYPCKENVSNGLTLYVKWTCQFITYHIPVYLHVTSIKILGKNLLVSVWFVARQVRIEVK